jgi:hypothetical protein
MKICAGHWTQLRTAIDTRGLTNLVAESGEQATRNLASELDHGSTIDNFDPLMAAHNAIMGNAMSAVQPGLLMTMMQGDNCPICWLKANDPTPYDYDQWIDLAADDALTAWQAMRP